MSEARDAADLFQNHRAELGFVNEAQCKEKTMYTEYRAGVIVGAILCNHCVRKPQTTLYDIAVRDSCRRDGVGSTLVDKMVSDSPHDKIIAKCPANLEANKFYESTGWVRESVEQKDDKRDLNVWRYDI